MNRNGIETLLGAVVLLCAALFLGFAYNSADIGKQQGYNVEAEFDRVDGLKQGGDVRLNGVLVGSVLAVGLDKTSNRAQVRFSVENGVKLPRDTMVQVASESLLGGKYLSLELGVEDALVSQDGTGKLTRTSPPVRLDDLIGQLIFSKEKDKGDGAEKTPAPTPPPAAMPATPKKRP